MKREYDAIIICDDRTVYSRLDLIHELEKLFKDCKYITTFILTNDNLIIARTLNFETIKIKIFGCKEFTRLLYEEHNCIVCTPLSGISSAEVSSQLNHIIDEFKNRKEVDDKPEDLNGMLTIDFPVMNTIKEKLNYLYGSKIFERRDLMIPKEHGLTTIEKVIFNPKATIVFWSDHTKTIVKLDKDDERDDEKGLAMAISKKFLGNKSNYYNEFRKWLK